MDSELINLIWDGFPGQDNAKAQLNAAALNQVHAYMFLGESGTVDAAFRFAALVQVQANDLEGSEASRVIDLCLRQSHADVISFEPEGSTLRVSDAEQIIAASATTPLESAKKVLIVTGVDEIEPAAIGKLLKVVEEPPPSTVFVLLAQSVLPEIITIASRCTQILFAPFAEEALVKHLVETGVDSATAELAAQTSGGNIERAKLLATDPNLAARNNFWKAIPYKLNGRGAVVSQLVNEVEAKIAEVLEVLEAEQANELARLDEAIKEQKATNQERSRMIASHKRAVRKLRTQELKSGLSLIAGTYRDAITTAVGTQAADELFAASDAIALANESLIRNPNEALLLQDLFFKLPSLNS